MKFVFSGELTLRAFKMEIKFLVGFHTFNMHINGVREIIYAGKTKQKIWELFRFFFFLRKPFCVLSLSSLQREELFSLVSYQEAKNSFLGQLFWCLAAWKFGSFWNCFHLEQTSLKYVTRQVFQILVFWRAKNLMEPFWVTFRENNGKNRIEIHFWWQLLN